MRAHNAEPLPLAADCSLSRIRGFLEALYPSGRMADERRSETRYPYPYPIYLTPVDEDGFTPMGESFSVLGKHISENGVGFYFPEPMPFRTVLVTLNAGRDIEPIQLLVDLTWCRYADGWYENGGKVLHEAPVAACN